jgi:hypothetical protein
VRLQKMPARRRAIAPAHHDVRVHFWPVLVQGNIIDEGEYLSSLCPHQLLLSNEQTGVES